MNEAIEKAKEALRTASGCFNAVIAIEDNEGDDLSFGAIRALGNIKRFLVKCGAALAALEAEKPATCSRCGDPPPNPTTHKNAKSARGENLELVSA